jgi:hypothetical protein
MSVAMLLDSVWLVKLVEMKASIHRHWRSLLDVAAVVARLISMVGPSIVYLTTGLGIGIFASMLTTTTTPTTTLIVMASGLG